MTMPFQSMGKVLIIAGIVLVVVGVFVYFGDRHGFLGLGRLPGDIRYEGRNVRVYVPIATSILLSLLLTAVLYIVSRFR